jgi:magnesium transporter
MNSEPKIITKRFESYKWIDICTHGVVDLKPYLGEIELDDFQLSDSLQHGHLPKYEDQGEYKFLILRLYTGTPTSKLHSVTEISTKLAIFYNEKTIITIHRISIPFLGDVVNSAPNSYNALMGIIRNLVSSFVEPAKDLTHNIDELEEVVFLKQNKPIKLNAFYNQKSRSRILLKLVGISQYVVNQIKVDEEHYSALQDIKDVLFNVYLDLEAVIENTQNLVNTHLSINAQKSNDVMKLLTVFSAFFLPLTFIVGVYGMNFENMPEITWKYGYFTILIVMLIVVLVIFFWFKRKKIM